MRRSQKQLKHTPQSLRKINNGQESQILEINQFEEKANQKKQEMQLIVLLLVMILTMAVIFITISSFMRKATVYQSSEPMPRTITTTPPRGQRK